ncbi:hypothetical protein CE91St34_10740 [Eggerthella lenta]|nr:hypothetical protein CE91St34_10740 [Eggerthella lenta]
MRSNGIANPDAKSNPVAGTVAMQARSMPYRARQASRAIAMRGRAREGGAGVPTGANGMGPPDVCVTMLLFAW